ncbi:hypothetical protein JCM14076_28740 [Methylosoma difficile]
MRRSVRGAKTAIESWLLLDFFPEKAALTTGATRSSVKNGMRYPIDSRLRLPGAKIQIAALDMGVSQEIAKKAATNNDSVQSSNRVGKP